MSKYKKIIQIIKKHHSFLITAHVNPDPDALCSSLALAEFLKGMGKKVFIVNEEPIPKRYLNLPGAKSIQHVKKRKKYHNEILIVLDSGELDRIGKVQQTINSNVKIINIDHHITNDHFGHYNLVEPQASSTAEILYELMTIIKKRLTKSIAQNLYSGILTDTGSFRYENTTPKTHLIAAKLQNYGLSVQKLYTSFYGTIPLKDAKEFAKLIGNFESLNHGRLIVMTLKKGVMTKFSKEFDLRDTIFKYLRSIKGAIVFVVFTECDDNIVRINFRSSRKVNVAKLAGQFNGGGHKRASGCMLNGSIKTVRARVIKEIRKRLAE